jgi:hypothetical protein
MACWFFVSRALTKMLIIDYTEIATYMGPALDELSTHQLRARDAGASPAVTLCLEWLFKTVLERLTILDRALADEAAQAAGNAPAGSHIKQPLTVDSFLAPTFDPAQLDVHTLSPMDQAAAVAAAAAAVAAANGQSNAAAVAAVQQAQAQQVAAAQQAAVLSAAYSTVPQLPIQPLAMQLPAQQLLQAMPQYSFSQLLLHQDQAMQLNASQYAAALGGSLALTSAGAGCAAPAAALQEAGCSITCINALL